MSEAGSPMSKFPLKLDRFVINPFHAISVMNSGKQEMFNAKAVSDIGVSYRTAEGTNLGRDDRARVELFLDEAGSNFVVVDQVLVAGRRAVRVTHSTVRQLEPPVPNQLPDFFNQVGNFDGFVFQEHREEARHGVIVLHRLLIFVLNVLEQSVDDLYQFLSDVLGVALAVAVIVEEVVVTVDHDVPLLGDDTQGLEEKEG